MARRKKPKNETPEQASIRKQLETISNYAKRSDKTSWKRKMKNMENLLAELRPIENKILELYATKEPIFDKIQDLRQLMINECIHPYELLIYKKDHVECKFCNRKLSLPKNVET